MARKARKRGFSGYYHIVVRGIGKQVLFEGAADYRCFLELLQKYVTQESAETIAFCLMDNHVHILLHADGGLDKIMKCVCGCYAAYYNGKYDRTGHLFQDRYKSEAVDTVPYLMRAVRYIHNNPVKAGICRREEYAWSSYMAYAGHRRPVGALAMVSTGEVLRLAGGREAFVRWSEAEDTEECLEYAGRRAVTDADALEFIKGGLRLPSGSALQGMGRTERDLFLRLMKEHGLSVRQIERLTGINRNAVQRA